MDLDDGQDRVVEMVRAKVPYLLAERKPEVGVREERKPKLFMFCRRGSATVPRAAIAGGNAMPRLDT